MALGCISSHQTAYYAIWQFEGTAGQAAEPQTLDFKGTSSWRQRQCCRMCAVYPPLPHLPADECDAVIAQALPSMAASGVASVPDNSSSVQGKLDNRVRSSFNTFLDRGANTLIKGVSGTHQANGPLALTLRLSAQGSMHFKVCLSKLAADCMCRGHHFMARLYCQRRWSQQSLRLHEYSCK